MSEDVTVLVLRAQGGDIRAFERLVVMYQKRVFYAVYRIVGQTHVADDVTQEVFIKVHHALERLKEPENFQGWLFRIAMNRAIDSKRRAKKTSEQTFLLEDFGAIGNGDSPPSHSEAMEMSELEVAVHRAIESLPDRQREVLSLTMDENLSQEEIAQVIDVPVGTVKSRLHHARRSLKEKLRRWLG